MLENNQENREFFSQKDFHLFCDISTSIHAIRNLDEMLRVILQKIKAAFRIEGASLALHDPAHKVFYFIRTIEEERYGKHPGMRKMQFPDHLGVAGWVLKKNETVIIPDVSKDDRFFKQFDFQENLKTRSMICIPLRTRKGPIGVLYAINKLYGEFTARESKLLEILSGTIAIAIENAQLNDEIKTYTSELEQENRRLRSEVVECFHLRGVIGSSPAMQRVLSLVEKVMNTETSVLIQGETGTGKELIARAIHYNGLLKDRPFIAENCGALSENILESELFGHVKGAFTNAFADKKGLFELADGGTIFLDEIGEMPLSMQVKLLRVLQEGQLRPVGGTRYRDVNFRLIVSTNRDLETEIEKGVFRADLFYRINVFPITMPPLRERREDIPLLAAHFIKKFTGKPNRPADRITPRAMEKLSSYSWPGNIRELENEIERALTLAGENENIREEHLSRKIQASPDTCISISDNGITLPEATERIEKQMVSEALRKCRGNKSKAARILGITRQGLLNKINRYDIKS